VGRQKRKGYKMSEFRNIDRNDALVMVGQGWAGLINELYDAMPSDTEVVQVKEKFGGLRFYVGFSTNEFMDLIDKCEERSYHICERCGKKGVLRENRRWILTLCDECNEKDIK
jgi:ribosomal protein L37AE/L43A